MGSNGCVGLEVHENDLGFDLVELSGSCVGVKKSIVKFKVEAMKEAQR